VSRAAALLIFIMLRVASSLLLVGGAHGEIKIDAMRHDIQQITAQNFDGVIGKFRDSTIAALWMFKDTPEDKKFMEQYNAVAGELKGMAKVCALSCDEWPVFCEKNNVKTTPALMMYPTNPMPAYLYEGKMETKAVSSRIVRMMPDLSTVLTAENADAWLTTDASKPKVMLFSNKKSPPMIFKALSSETVFKRSIKFGFVQESEADLVSKFKIKKFPAFVMQRGSKGETKEQYKGEMKFHALQEWINLFSESGMGDKISGGGKEEESIEEAKPWLVQEVPELTGKSSNDICIKGEGLCVIYLKAGGLTSSETDMLSGLSKKFTSQLSDRGAKMKWMWMNTEVEVAYKELFEPDQLPSAVVFNPHKRLRFNKMDHGEDGDVKADEVGLVALMDKVLGGDARFKMVPGQKMPQWAQRTEAPKDKKKSEL